MKKRLLYSVVLVGGLALAGFFYVSYRTSFSHGPATMEKVFRVDPGDNFVEVGRKLEADGLVSWKWYFAYYVWREGLRHKILAGEYGLNGGMAIPEIARILTRGEVVSTAVTVTFPEGWDSRKMAERLDASNLPGEEFLALVDRPKPEWMGRFGFLEGVPRNASLEGFLFPDTYTFAKDASAEDIVVRMLKNFDTRVPGPVRTDIAKQNKSLFEVLTLASVVENEVRSTEDRKRVADLFWRRLRIGQPLQSDATVKYILGKNKIQHSVEETRVDSPYNTYVNKGLPPGPIANPGMDAFLATVYPIPNAYYYFLSDPETGETVFAETFEEHKINKEKHGL
jgi:UPF0755 protein